MGVDGEFFVFGLCCLAGLGERFLLVEDPDDRAILERGAREAAEQRKREAEEAAKLIADGTRKVLGG